MDHTQCLVKIIELFCCMYTKRNILEDVNCTPGHGSLLQTSAGYHAFMPAVNTFMQAITRYSGCQRVHAGCQFSPISSWCDLGPSVRSICFLLLSSVGSLPLAKNALHFIVMITRHQYVLHMRIRKRRF